MFVLLDIFANYFNYQTSKLKMYRQKYLFKQLNFIKQFKANKSEENPKCVDLI